MGRLLYRHTQIGTLILFSLAIGALIVIGAGGRMAGPLLAALLLTAFLFSTLTVEVDEENLAFFFGPGFLRRSLPLKSIRSFRVVRNPWWYGWGIHLTPHGWLYNVSGWEAVELELEDGRRLRIGTDEPQRLAQALREALGMEEEP